MTDTLTKILAVATGGALGSVARYLAVKSIDARLNAVFPYGTLAVNLLGSFILGMVAALALRKVGVTEHWRLFVGTGICGGFTTFSAFALENVNLLGQRLFGTSLIYIAISIVGGLLALSLGAWMGRFL